MHAFGPRQIAALVVVALAFLWPVAGDRIQALFTSDTAGCAHSSDLPGERNQSEMAAAILCLLNAERAAHGLAPLAPDARLESAAQTHAEDMGRRQFYAHENPSGLSPADRMQRAGYRGSTGENIHWGVGSNGTPARIMRDWMNSPGHRENILRPIFTRVGVGVATEAPRFAAGDAVGVFVQNFGG